MKELPLISVITPTLNAEKTIGNCIESIIKQNYPYLEHIIVDGISKDNTLEIIKDYAKKYNHIKYLSEKDNGIYDAMNKGIDLSKGYFLIFLGADDVLVENALNNVFNKVDDWKKYDLIYGKVKYGNIIFGQEFKIERVTDEMRKKNFIPYFIPHNGCFINNNLFNLYGKYDLKFPIGADCHFFLRIMNNINVNKLFVDEMVTEMGTNGMSSKEIDDYFAEKFPTYVKKYLDIDISRKDLYRSISHACFNEIYSGNLLYGLMKVLKFSFYTSDYLYYIKNSAYWIKERIKKRLKDKSKILNSSTCCKIK
jgi:glycosyltransferase involved in cell wall biosynthesis